MTKLAKNTEIQSSKIFEFSYQNSKLDSAYGIGILAFFGAQIKNENSNVNFLYFCDDILRNFFKASFKVKR